PLSTTGSITPQPPGRTAASLRAAASRRRDSASPGGTPGPPVPPAPPNCAPPARPCALLACAPPARPCALLACAPPARRPAREAMKITVSTHILDTALGRPAAGVPVTLDIWSGGTWVPAGGSVTGPDGRSTGLPPLDPDVPTSARLVFAVRDYL